MMREDSDAESDFEKEIMKNDGIVDEEESDPEQSDNDTKEASKNNGSFHGRNVRDNNHGLRLSESDSSDEDQQRFSIETKPEEERFKPCVKSSYFGDDDDDSDDELGASQKLLALAGNLETVKNAW